MNRSGDQTENGQNQQSYVKQEAVAYGYEASYLNYTNNNSSNPMSLNQPLPGQPPLPPMPPPQASVPPPPAMFAPVQPIHPWPAAAWQWIPQAVAPQAQLGQHRDKMQYAFKEAIPQKNIYRRERFGNNRHNVYQQRGEMSHRKHNRRGQQQRFNSSQRTFDQASYYPGSIANQGLGMEWPLKPNEHMGHMQLPSPNALPPANASSSAKQENSKDLDKKEEAGLHKKNKQRKPMSVSYPSRPWNQEDAEKALKTENEHNRSVRAQSLIIKFPDPELNKDVVRGFHSGIQNIHFQSPSGARYCFVQMKEGTNIDECIKELEKIKFGCGYLKVERKSLRDEDNPMPQEIDPYTLYIGNLPEALNVNEVKNRFPTAVRVDVGYAQKMRNTRYAFIRYNTVDESIAAYKSAHNLMWDGRSIIVRFRRQRGNNSSGEPKKNPKITKEAAKTAANDTDSAKIIEEQSSPVEENEHITSDKSRCTENSSINVTKKIDFVKTLTSENTQDLQNQSKSSLESSGCYPSEDSDVLADIKEEPIDYEESNEPSIEEDDEDEEGELYDSHLDYMNYDDDADLDIPHMSPFKIYICDKSSDDSGDNLDTVFKDLVNTAHDIGVIPTK